jgi:hypothetical protein
VTIKIGENTIETTKANFTINLILLRPFCQFNKTVKEKFLMDTSKIDSYKLSKHFTKLIKYFSDEDYRELNECIAEIIEELADISGDFNVLSGNTMSLFGLIELANKNKEFNNLLHFEIPKGMQFNEIEDLLKQKTNELNNILCQNENILRNYINSKTGINTKQLSQTILCVGPKPSLDGKIIPIPINTSFIRGLRSIVDFYINATGGRKALITNYKQVKNAGYLTRKLTLLALDSNLDYEEEDCCTNHYIKCFIDSNETIQRLNGRWYRGEDNKLHLINSYMNNEKLIGRTLDLRSPITCCSKNICRTCYGDNLAKLNRELHVGILSVVLLTSQLTQMLLSAKHLLQTNSSKIDWPKSFLKYLFVDRNMVLPVTTTGGFSLVIDVENIQEDDETLQKYITEFSIKEQKGKEFKIKSPVNLLLTDSLNELLDYYKRGENIVIPFKIFNPDAALFTFTTENNELSASLKNILDLIETSTHLGLTDIHEIYNKFISLLNESNLTIDSVHIEILLRALTRDPYDLTQRPDFSTSKFPEFLVLRVTNAILNSPSVAVRLAFERLKKQITSPEIYSASGESILDELF